MQSPLPPTQRSLVPPEKPYVFQEYPKHLYNLEGKLVVVKSPEEEDKDDLFESPAAALKFLNTPSKSKEDVKEKDQTKKEK